MTIGVSLYPSRLSSLTEMSLLEPLPEDDEFSRLRRGMMFYTSPSPSSLLKPYAPRVQGEVYGDLEMVACREGARRMRVGPPE
jgi:hypothetical protein